MTNAEVDIFFVLLQEAICFCSYFTPMNCLFMSVKERSNMYPYLNMTLVVERRSEQLRYRWRY